MTSPHLISLVVPLYNEASGLESFHQSLLSQLELLKQYEFEIIYCNDGSTDRSLQLLLKLADSDKRVRIVSLSRNFGKEAATTAGLREATGIAVITLDADGQHPVELLPKLLGAWNDGALVVVGLRTSNLREGLIKRYGSKLFYRLFNGLTGIKMMPGASDFRLIDSVVCDDFKQLTEHNRITRGLIDWLGYDRVYVEYRAKARMHGDAAYSFRKLFKLAIDSFISLSSSPLYVMALIGALVLPFSILLGAVMTVNALTGDPLQWHAAGSAYVLVFALFLIGVLMMSQGIIGLYLSHIHSETQNRPLYVIDERKSKRI